LTLLGRKKRSPQKIGQDFKPVVVGGKTAEIQDWPWMAALLRDGSDPYCGATLITTKHVVTAAHCTKP
jgi:secreted trypsin-like serine protease